MPSPPVHVLIVVGSQNRGSSTRALLQSIAGLLREAGASVDLLDLPEEPLPLFNPDSSHRESYYAGLKARVEKADVYLLGTPDYHGSISGVLKNFLDHFWPEFAGKLFASVVASYDKGLTVTDQVRTIARQCYAWSLPYAVSFADKTDVKDGQILTDSFRQRVTMLARDLRIYGELLAAQRRKDLAGNEPGFLARYRG
jgi:FMN reductase